MDEAKIIGVLVQTGSLGLLAFIVVWLTKWVPKRIERADLVRETEARSREVLATAHEAAVKALVEANAQEQRDMLAAFAAEQQKERDGCERRYAELFERIGQLHLLVREVKHETGNMAQVQANHRAAEQIRRGRGHRAEEGGT